MYRSQVLRFAVCLAFLLLAEVAVGQALNPNVTSTADLDAFAADLADRQRSLPTDGYQVFVELQRTQNDTTTVRTLLVRYRVPNTTGRELADLQKDWMKRKGDLLELRPGDPREEDAARELFVQLGSMRQLVYGRHFDNMPAFRRLDQAANLLYRAEKGDGATNSTRTLETIRRTIVPAVDALLAELPARMTEDQAEFEKIISKLEVLERDLASYSKTLGEQRAKVETQRNLKTNLHWMILVIGGLSVSAIGLIRLFPERAMLEWVESGQVIQFVTVMILLSTIMALGLAGLLSENTLGTLLGGIGGYVLSQGVGRAAARMALRNQDRLSDDTVSGLRSSPQPETASQSPRA